MSDEMFEDFEGEDFLDDFDVDQVLDDDTYVDDEFSHDLSGVDKCQICHVVHFFGVNLTDEQREYYLESAQHLPPHIVKNFFLMQDITRFSSHVEPSISFLRFIDDFELTTINLSHSMTEISLRGQYSHLAAQADELYKVHNAERLLFIYHTVIRDFHTTRSMVDEIVEIERSVNTGFDPSSWIAGIDRSLEIMQMAVDEALQTYEQTASSIGYERSTGIISEGKFEEGFLTGYQEKVFYSNFLFEYKQRNYGHTL
jgi:hypothetical protein